MQRRIPCLNGIELMGNREREKERGRGVCVCGACVCVRVRMRVCVCVCVFPIASALKKINVKTCN